MADDVIITLIETEDKPKLDVSPAGITSLMQGGISGNVIKSVITKMKPPASVKPATAKPPAKVAGTPPPTPPKKGVQ